MSAVERALDLASRDGPIHTGAIRAQGGGRTDNIPMRVPSNSYVIPADVVSAMPGAEGNSDAGHQLLDELLSTGPYGAQEGSLPYGASGGPFGIAARAKGGSAPGGEGHIPIIAASGEYVVGPQQVMAIGAGNMKTGHKVLDALVEKVRKQNIATLRKLPGPVKK